MQKKFKDRVNLVDKMARMSVKKIKLSESAINCYYWCNHDSDIDKATNVGLSIDECPRCSKIETWEHAVQYRKTFIMRAEFILKLHEDLKEVQSLEWQMRI